MKLRNKKTGEILYMYSEAVNRGGEPEIILFPRGQIHDENKAYHYNTLAELNEEWEDYEEPKKYWTLDGYGYVMEMYEGELSDEKTERDKEIGNYFETKEEAEKAVEKLKAWKRLKDARFKFKDFCYGLDEKSSNLISADGQICFEMMCYEDFFEDLKLLFDEQENLRKKVQKIIEDNADYYDKFGGKE